MQHHAAALRHSTTRRSDLLKEVKVDAPGKRHLCKGCWGREWLAGSEVPGITSTGTAPASWHKHSSTSLFHNTHYCDYACAGLIESS